MPDFNSFPRPFDGDFNMGFNGRKLISKVNFSRFPCKFPRKDDCTFSFIDPRHVLSSTNCRFQQSTPFDDDFNMVMASMEGNQIFKSRFFTFFVQIFQKGRLFPFILTLDNPDPLIISFFLETAGFQQGTPFDNEFNMSFNGRKLYDKRMLTSQGRSVLPE